MAVAAPEPAQPRGRRHEGAELERHALLQQPGAHRRCSQRAPLATGHLRYRRQLRFSRAHADAATFARLDVARRRPVVVARRRRVLPTTATARSSNDASRHSA